MYCFVVLAIYDTLSRIGRHFLHPLIYWIVYRYNSFTSFLYCFSFKVSVNMCLKILSSEMDQAESRLIRRPFLKETSRRVFRKIRPSPIEWEPFKVWELSYFSFANYAVNLDSCGDIHCALGPPLAIENRRNWGVFLKVWKGEAF